MSATPTQSLFNLSPGTRHVTVLSVCALLMIGVAVTGVSDVFLERGNPRLALRIWPGSTDASSGRAIQLNNEGNTAEAQALAVKALRISPMNSEALRVIVLTAQSQRQDDVAEAGLVLAARLGWRDGLIQLWLLNRSLAQGNAVAASQAADALLRIRFADAEVRGAITTLMQTASGRTALAERMSGDVPWASSMIQDLRSDTEENAQNAAKLLLAVNDHAPLSDNDIRPFIEAALTNGHRSLVRKLWHALHPAVSIGPVDGLSDGDFTEIASAPTAWQPFGWHVNATSDVGVTLPSQPKSHGNAFLRVDADGSRMAVPISQNLTLSSGAHLFSFRYKLNGAAYNTFVWEIRCSDRSSRLVAQVPVLFTAAQEWQTQKTRFTIPYHCVSQVVRLVVRPSLTNASTGMFRSLQLGPA